MALNSELSLDRIFVERSFSHTFDELYDVRYLPSEMLHFFDPLNARQLKYCTKNAYEKSIPIQLAKSFRAR